MAITDDFNRANSGGLGANWGNTTSDSMRIVSNTARPTVDGVYQFNFYSGSSWNSDHGSQAVVNDNTGSADAELTVRHQSGSGDLYMFMVHTSVLRLYKYIGAAFTQLGGDLTGAEVDGHTYKLTATGTTLEAFDNGGSLGTRTDATLTGGFPGIGGSVSTEQWDDWQGTGEVSALRFILGTH